MLWRSKSQANLAGDSIDLFKILAFYKLDAAARVHSVNNVQQLLSNYQYITGVVSYCRCHQCLQRDMLWKDKYYLGETLKYIIVFLSREVNNLMRLHKNYNCSNAFEANSYNLFLLTLQIWILNSKVWWIQFNFHLPLSCWHISAWNMYFLKSNGNSKCRAGIESVQKRVLERTFARVRGGDSLIFPYDCGPPWALAWNTSTTWPSSLKICAACTAGSLGMPSS